MSPSAEKQEYAYQLRKKPTEAERLFLAYARNLIDERPELIRCRPMYFQSIVRGYIPDFYFPRLHATIEVDGPIHNDPRIHARDLAKRRHLENSGISMLSVTNDMVYQRGPSFVYETLCSCAQIAPDPTYSITLRAQPGITTRFTREVKKHKSTRTVEIKDFRGHKWIDINDFRNKKTFHSI